MKFKVLLLLLVLAIGFSITLGLSEKEKSGNAILPAGVGAATVFDTEGQPVKLGDMWQTKPAVLVFVRHFG